MQQCRIIRCIHVVCHRFFQKAGIRSVLRVYVILFVASTFTFGQTRNSESDDDISITPNDVKGPLRAAMEPALEKSNGHWTPEVRNAYMAWATNRVLTMLDRHEQTVPDDCLAEVVANPELIDAIYGSVYPPDPSVLQNYARFRAELGPAFMAKYHSLVIAAAVVQRVRNTATNDDDDMVPAGMIRDVSLKRLKTAKENSFVTGIADFMKTNRVSALDLYEKENLQTQLVAFLKERDIAPSMVARVKPSLPFGEDLKNAMVVLGQRPAAREPVPDMATWLRYVTALYESTPTSTPVIKGKAMAWPLFPIAQAPWPLLMPLVRPVPLGEARFMWARFQDAGSNDRFHTYGPYRKPDKEMPYQLQPSAWFWSAWPDEIVHGGECIPISIGAIEFYNSLGKPAGFAGQPGHANLIVNENDHGVWKAKIEQAYAGGPDLTWGRWLFNDKVGANLRFRKLHNWAGSEYFLGLAMAMNKGLSSYLDTRMIGNIYNALPPEEQQTYGQELLKDGLKASRFNPNIWYRLAQQEPDAIHGIDLVRTIMNQPSGDANYWKTVAQFAAHYGILDKSNPGDKATVNQVCTFLATVPGIKPAEIKSYAQKFSKQQ